MSELKKIIKSKLNQFLTEDDVKTIKKSGSVTGDIPAARMAKASAAIDKIKDNLRSMGISAPDTNHIYTVEQLKVAPFGIDFKIVGKENEWGESDIKSVKTRAKYNKSLSDKHNTIVLDLKNGWTVMFNPDELNMNIPGTQERVVGLANGKEYTINSMGSFDELTISEAEGGTVFKLHLNDIVTVGDDTDKEKDKTDVRGVGGWGSIRINKTKGNSDWTTGNVESAINRMLDGNVTVRKSEKFDDTLVVEWVSGVKIGRSTQAMLVSGVDDIWNKFMGDRLKNTTVKLGRKIGGLEQMDEDTTGIITLRVKN